MKKIITILILLIFTMSTSYCTLTDNLVAYYKFDGDTTDSSGNSYDGTNYGATTTSSGKINDAYYFDGTDDYIDLNSLIPINFGTTTTNLWINSNRNFNSVGNDDYFISAYSNYYNRFHVTPNTGGSGCVFYTYTASTSFSDYFYDCTPILTNYWNMVTIISNGAGSSSLYINANKITDGNFNKNLPNITGGRIYLGAYANMTGGYAHYEGYIDEVGIWSTNFSLSEIETLYNNGAGLQYPFGVSSYNLSVGEANSVIDDVFEEEFTNPIITNNQLIYTSFQSGITTQRIYNRYIETGNKRFAIYYGTNPSSEISQDGVFYTFESGYLPESELRSQLEDFIDNS